MQGGENWQFPRKYRMRQAAICESPYHCILRTLHTGKVSVVILWWCDGGGSQVIKTVARVVCAYCVQSIVLSTLFVSNLHSVIKQSHKLFHDNPLSAFKGPEAQRGSETYFSCIISFNPHHTASRGSALFVPILQMRKLKHKKVNNLTKIPHLGNTKPGVTAINWPQSQY